MQVQQDKKEDDYYYSNYVNALKSKTTKNDYTKRLSYFMDFLGINNKNYYELIENRDKKWIENSIKDFLVYLRNERKISYKSAAHYLDAIKKFYYVNSEFDFKWKLIKMYLGDDDDDVNDDDVTTTTTGTNTIEEDRPYTKLEIQTMLNTATDIRIKNNNFVNFK